MIKKSIILFCCAVVTLLPDYVNADWKDEANARIEQYRKRDVSISIFDGSENVSGATVEVRQKRRHFGFGAELSHTHFVNYPEQREFFKNHFEWATIRNFKWQALEPSNAYGAAYDFSEIETLYQYCEENNIKIRGHRVFSAGGDVDWTDGINDGDCLAAMSNYLNQVMNYTVSRPRVKQVDVNNEMLERNYYNTRFGDPIRVWMFQQAKLLNPNMELYINDYSVVAESRLTAQYVTLIQNLLAAGAPIDGIGAQCHFNPDYGCGEVDPVAIKQRLDQLAVLGLPIWATEFHCEDYDEYGRADKLEAFYRTAFSHPAVEGIIMWGFWGAAHAAPYGTEACMVNADWTLNAAGDRYVSLMNEWRTDIDAVSDNNGEVNFRGFHGIYEINVQYGDQIETFEIELLPADTTAQYVLEVCPLGDLSGDCKVDFKDFTLFANDWGADPQTVTLQQGLNGYAGTQDTYIWSLATGYWNMQNFGGQTEILVRNQADVTQDQEGMIRFDVSSIAAGSTVQSAKLKLYYFAEYGTPGSETLNLTRLKRYWEEGNGGAPGVGTGYNVGAGGVCWLYYDYLETGNESSNWVPYGRSWISRTDGAAGAKGTGDAYSTVSGSVTYTGTGTYGNLTNPQWIEIDVTSDIQAMINEPENWGWLMQTVGGRRPRLYSSEATDAALRPILEIVYKSQIADINLDNIVDFNDMMLICVDWLKGI